MQVDDLLSFRQFSKKAVDDTLDVSLTYWHVCPRLTEYTGLGRR